MESELPNPSKIKLIVCDIDGTLLDPSGHVTDRTATVIKKILKEYPDLYFALASGRSRPGIIEIREKLDIMNNPKTEFILCNGSIICDYTGNIIWENTLSIEFLIKFYETLKDHPNNSFAFLSGDDSIMFDEEWARRAQGYGEQTVVVNKEEFIEKIKAGKVKINKVGFLVYDEAQAQEIEEFTKELRNEYDIECAFTDIFLEFLSKGINKGSGLSQFLKQVHITKDEVIAFGNGGNDIQLFKNSGWPIAMENSQEVLKEHAKLFTKTNSEDGVAYMLEKIFLKK
ncbi:hypothetical protein H8356DRAFT_1662446 [Neocallimastix lanati (nom. inval.)]|nr:hypothetical protein H8356DRAFT_1662446 [Neocallimastix sp. JGI-2020a]